MQDLLSKGDWKSQVAEGLPPEIADEVPLELFGQITGLPTGATHVPWDGPKLRVIEHRAHAQGHAALLVEECGVLIAGDMLSDVFVPMLDFSSPAPLDDYLAALQLFRAIADDVIAVVPGHGSVGNADELRARIELDRTYAQTLHDGGVSQDPRVVSPKEGWEWVADIHEGQVQQIAQKNS
jgi:glyoxylase-like metal-dependent hydrolase (beta-lactamase superfamily II)